MAITYYRRLGLPVGGVAAAQACLEADPPRPPGSPDEFARAATRLGLIAQTLRDALATLARIADEGSVWTGQAADAFWTLLKDPQRAHYDQVPERYDGYGRALRAYAAELGGHQAGIDSARAGVQAALDAYRRVVVAAPTPWPASTSFTMPPADTDPRHRGAVQECEAAARAFQTTYNAWIDAAAACQHAIKRVDGDKLHNPHGASAVPHGIDNAFHAAVDQVARLADVVSTVSGILALVALPWPPAAAVLLLVSTLSSGVRLAADLDRRLQYGEKVTGADFAFDALGTVPLGKPGSVAVEAGRTARLARSAGLLGALHTGGDAFAKTFAADVARTFTPKGVKQTVTDLAKVEWRPDSNAVPPALGQIALGQDLALTTAQAGRQAFDDRKRGSRAMERATLTVALGPFGSQAATAVDACRDSLGKLPRLATAGVP